MKRDSVFLRVAAICAFLSAITTFLLWLLPFQYSLPPSQIQLFASPIDPYYLARLWVNLFHIPLALIGYLGLTFVLSGREGFKAIAGMLWFLIWGIVEMLGISLLIFTVQGDWRNEYLSASLKRQEELNFASEAMYSVWGSLFFVLLIAFLLGTFFMGWAAWQEGGWGKYLGGLFLLAVPLTLVIILSRYAGWEALLPLISWIYPLLQPFSRAFLGLYLWRAGDNPPIHSSS